MKYLVADLEGILLDEAVAKADGANIKHGILREETVATGVRVSYWSPSTSWACGGPIIERERIDLEARANGGWYAVAYRKQAFDSVWPGFGQAPLIAAMRAYVCSKFGAEVELP